MMKYTYRILCLNEDTSIKVLDYNSIHKIKCYEDFKSLEDKLNKIGTINGCIINYFEFKQKGGIKLWIGNIIMRRKSGS